PSAVLEAAKLIADGITGQYNGLGELLLVDVGGATTDVYTVASGVPTRGDVNVVGLREPYAKRTVEGDLGLFHNLDTLSEIADKVDVETVESLRASLSIPDGEEQCALQMTLTRLAVKTAVTRHVGRADVVMTGNGPVTVQRGKDMTKCRLVIGAGGPVAFSADPKWVLGGAVKQDDEVSVLKPENPKFMTDDKYILFAIGLMSQTEPEKALRIIKKYLKEI
ncbi:MAG: glutamate mutase L, partial [Oscillospiraceae bacterium]|nr:glutamate mutase L [Oscillospiraceae bacterium]